MKTPFQLSQSHCVKSTWTKCPCSHPDTLQSGRGPMHLLIFPNTEAGFISFEPYYELFHKYTKKRWHFRWIQGSIDPRFDGSKGRWIQGSMDPRFDGSKGRWIQGSIDPRFDGSKGRWIQGSIDPRFDGSKGRWIQGSIDPRFDGSKGRWI